MIKVLLKILAAFIIIVAGIAGVMVPLWDYDSSPDKMVIETQIERGMIPFGAEIVPDVTTVSVIGNPQDSSLIYNFAFCDETYVSLHTDEIYLKGIDNERNTTLDYSFKVDIPEEDFFYETRPFISSLSEDEEGNWKITTIHEKVGRENASVAGLISCAIIMVFAWVVLSLIGWAGSEAYNRYKRR